jgi:glycosyltransferase involved in cell wall biosynthesis
MKISWLCSIYINTAPSEFLLALSSIYNQDSDVDFEIVIVVDGPILCELDWIVSRLDNYSHVKLHRIPVNAGLGPALAAGFSLCDGDYVFRFDTDDINSIDRVSVQLSYLLAHPSVDIIGSSTIDFFPNPQAPSVLSAKRSSLPSLKCLSALDLRNTLNHPSVVLKRSALQSCGLCYTDVPFFEDYFLWLEARRKGLIIHNVPESLVYTRSCRDYSRRIGLGYAVNELRFYSKSYSNRLFKSILFVPFHVLRLLIRFLPFSGLQRLIRSRLSFDIIPNPDLAALHPAVNSIKNVL